MIAVLMACAEFSHYDEQAFLFRLIRSRDYTQNGDVYEVWQLLAQPPYLEAVPRVVTPPGPKPLSMLLQCITVSTSTAYPQALC